MDLYVTAQSTGLSDSSPLIRFTWMWSLSYVLCYSVSYRKSWSLFLSASDLVKCLLRVSFVLAWPVGCTSARSLKVSVDLQMRRSYLSFESVLLDVVYLFFFSSSVCSAFTLFQSSLVSCLWPPHTLSLSLWSSFLRLSSVFVSFTCFYTVLTQTPFGALWRSDDCVSRVVQFTAVASFSFYPFPVTGCCGTDEPSCAGEAGYVGFRERTPVDNDDACACESMETGKYCQHSRVSHCFKLKASSISLP